MKQLFVLLASTMLIFSACTKKDYVGNGKIGNTPGIGVPHKTVKTLQ